MSYNDVIAVRTYDDLEERKAEVVGKDKKSDADTGSPEVQIAILTERINGLTEHMRTHRKDYATAWFIGIGQPTPPIARLRSQRGSPEISDIIGKLGIRK